MLKKPLKNQLFSSLQALRDRIQEIFDQLTFEQVISISSYNFILEALFYAVHIKLVLENEILQATVVKELLTN
ncbi:hypothetical protein [uncultured Nostoc sp.]|uniref:hypothetical protein n=1 Tax=uncultured Nostoc sp. TaxID=340711 RepID=UPI0035CB69D7